MITERNIVRAVSSLNILTKSDALKWVSKHVPASWYVDNTSEKTISPAYDTYHEGRYLRLFKYTARHYTDEDAYSVTAYVALCILDSDGSISWEFPQDRSIYDLYETVRYKLADVEGFLNRLTANLPEETSESQDLPF